MKNNNFLQNNNRGGYNVGDKTDQASGNNEDNQYRMVRYYYHYSAPLLPSLSLSYFSSSSPPSPPFPPPPFPSSLIPLRGYNFGDKTDQGSGNNEDNQYRMVRYYYYYSAPLPPFTLPLRLSLLFFFPSSSSLLGIKLINVPATMKITNTEW